MSGGGRQAILVDLPAGLPPVMADRRPIVQMLNNLLWNAARHPPAESRNDDRKPWATAALPWHFSIFGNVAPAINLPLHIGHQIAVAADLPRGLEDLHRPPAKRDPVLALGLHPFSRYCPYAPATSIAPASPVAPQRISPRSARGTRTPA